MNEFIHVKDAEENMNIDEFFLFEFFIVIKIFNQNSLKSQHAWKVNMSNVR
jgi:hypothetical protein